jgi:hypothetical protein
MRLSPKLVKAALAGKAAGTRVASLTPFIFAHIQKKSQDTIYAYHTKRGSKYDLSRCPRFISLHLRLMAPLSLSDAVDRTKYI